MRYFYQNLIELKKIVFWFILFAGWSCMGQNLYLQISGTNPEETQTIDSIGYVSKHNNAKSIVAESDAFSEKLSKIGYLEHELESNVKTNDSVFTFRYRLGKRTAMIRIYIGTNPQLQTLSLFDNKKDTLVMPYADVEVFLNGTLDKLEKKGYALSKLQLVNIKKNGNNLSADLKLSLENRRQVNEIVINGYDKFPAGHKANIQRMYRNKIFNQGNLKKIYNDFEKFRFIKQVKYPEILFAKDSTKIYVYLEKAQANSFDGYIGFSNNEQEKIIFNGYVDLALNNIVNTGETLTLYWKSDGEKQKTFNAAVELPYVFKSPFGLKAQLNIFKQDSTFQNTKTAVDIGYFFNYNTRLYLGYQSTESSDIQNANTSGISDFKNSFVTTNFEFLDFKPEDFLFPQKTRVNMKFGLGNRVSKFQNNKQLFVSVDLAHNIYLNDKNSINIKSQDYYLKSDVYIVNELYRFGGINSIRGFNENSLQASLYTSILTEYRYVLTPGIYTHSIIDYGYYEDQTSQNKGTLLGLGFGFGLLTKNGLFNIIYANGSAGSETIKLSNSIIHVSFKVNF